MKRHLVAHVSMLIRLDKYIHFCRQAECPTAGAGKGLGVILNTEKQESGGRAEISALFDAGTFVELGAYVRRKGDRETYDAVLCGYGAVEGKLTFAFAQDCDRLGGAFDETGAEKVEKLYQQAIRSGAPVVGIFNSAGAVVFDGAPALSAYGRLMKCVSDASGVVPQIALISGVCAGMAAVAASLFDVSVAVKGDSELYINPPSIVGKETGGVAYAAAGGLVSMVAEDAGAARAAVRSLIDLLPLNNRDTADVDAMDDPGRPVTVTGLAGGELAAALADGGRVVSLYADYGKELFTGLCRMGGRTVGVVASDPTVSEGRLSTAGAKKVARLVSFCDSFSLPVVTLVDSVGVEDGADPALAPALGRLATAYLTSTTAKVTCVTGKAYGAAFTLLGSRALGADLALALPEAVISVLPPESAVAFAWNDKVSTDTPRETVEAQWRELYATPRAAAESGDIDDVIAPEELRARLCAALYMLAGKADGTPDRKHGTMPL